jgi:hypothetical protein
MPLVKYTQYVNNPTISAGSPIVKITTRLSSIFEIRISASSGEYSVCWMEPYEAGVLAGRGKSPFLQEVSALAPT